MIDLIRKKVCIPLIEKRRGNRRLRYMHEVKKVLESSRSEQERWQSEKLKEIVSYAYKHVPFYNSTYRSFPVGRFSSMLDMSELPCIEKEDIRQNGSRMLSGDFRKEDMLESATGGTTQAPITFYLDAESYARRQAAMHYFYHWFNRYESGDKIAYIWGAEQDYSKVRTVKSRLIDFLTYRKLFLGSSYLNDETMYMFYERLRSFKPKLLQSYVNPLYIFSEFLKKNGLFLDIPSINVTAEPLYDYQRELIEEVFAQKVYNWYGARDFGHGATECSLHKGMHLNTYGLYVEVIKDGKPVFDEYGDIVVTDLFNKAMPIIRYKIGDLGLISTRVCECGIELPILADLIGRVCDVFRKKDGTYVPGKGLSFETRKTKGISQYQIIQRDYGIFHLNIVKANDYTDESLSKFKNGICELMHEDLKFTVDFLGEIRKEKSGKIRFCKCEIVED